MKSLFVLSLTFVSAIASAAGLQVPAGYKAVLDCPATKKGSPHFMVVAQSKKIYLAATVSGAVRLFKLSVEDGDCGYTTFTAAKGVDLGKLEKLASYIYVYSNDEDIEDPNKAIVTGGAISPEGRSHEQECNSVGRVRVNDLF